MAVRQEGYVLALCMHTPPCVHGKSYCYVVENAAREADFLLAVIICSYEQCLVPAESVKAC